MAKKPVSPRTKRRADVRKMQGLVRDQIRLAALEPGGSAERPIGVVSASLVEPHARSTPCPLCGGAVRVLEHEARADQRQVHVLCTQCGVRRIVHFRIEAKN